VHWIEELEIKGRNYLRIAEAASVISAHKMFPGFGEKKILAFQAELEERKYLEDTGRLDKI
jgi:hypothetical protein